mmetsp:Transcript_108850/g.234443  ORF Transcript_108850/g.234443 Transcript_108850/m.234443 type:complete len:408 (+) Transcript_108850:627-1850(+)
MVGILLDLDPAKAGGPALLGDLVVHVGEVQLARWGQVLQQPLAVAVAAVRARVDEEDLRAHAILSQAEAVGRQQVRIGQLAVGDGHLLAGADGLQGLHNHTACAGNFDLGLRLLRGHVVYEVDHGNHVDVPHGHISAMKARGDVPQRRPELRRVRLQQRRVQLPHVVRHQHPAEVGGLLRPHEQVEGWVAIRRLQHLLEVGAPLGLVHPQPLLEQPLREGAEGVRLAIVIGIIVGLAFLPGPPRPVTGKPQMQVLRHVQHPIAGHEVERGHEPSAAAGHGGDVRVGPAAVLPQPALEVSAHGAVDVAGEEGGQGHAEEAPGLPEGLRHGEAHQPGQQGQRQGADPAGGPRRAALLPTAAPGARLRLGGGGIGCSSAAAIPGRLRHSALPRERSRARLPGENLEPKRP